MGSARTKPRWISTATRARPPPTQRALRGSSWAGRTRRSALWDRNEVFVRRIFKLQYTESVSPCSEQFKKECGESSLFTDNGRYVIVGSAAFVPEEPNVLPRSGMYSAYNETNINLKNLLKTDC